MKVPFIYSILCSLILALYIPARPQSRESLPDRIVSFPDKFFKKVNDKAENINNSLVKQTEKYLKRLAREERRLKRKLMARDSSAAARISNDASLQYAGLQNKIRTTPGKVVRLHNKYIPHLDTLRTALTFLEGTTGFLGEHAGAQAGIDKLAPKLDRLQANFSQVEEIHAALKHRRLFLQEQLSKYGLGSDLKRLQKHVYYYRAQVEEYRNTLEDPSKWEAKAIELLRQTSAFKDFFNKHSQLAGLFRLPGNSGNINASFAGLQTRDAIREQLMQRFGNGADAERIMQQQVQGGRTALSQIKDRINKLAGGKSGMEMPDFKPNNQKTKSFKKRLEFGTNLQTVKSNRFFPSTTDIGLSLGYKLNEKSVVGIGSAYKMGWGKDIRHITITHQGIGLRSFLDYRLKGKFWLSGGAEMNYRSAFNDFEILSDYSSWQKSALVGIAKKYQVSSKMKGNMQVFYDFMWRHQVPRTQPVLFRVGYQF